MLKYIFLGIIQGLTEFFPVSSSGHLVILQKLFGISGQEISLVVVLHLGTLLAIIIFFFKDILKALANLKFLALIFIVTLITGIIGISGKDFFEGLFISVKFTALALIATGIILLVTHKFMDGKREELNPFDAAILGITQGLAIIPGISRSGITISTLLFRKIDRKTSFRFSFLVSIPAVLGALLLEAPKLGFSFRQDTRNFFLGFLASFITGLIALRLFKIIINKARLNYFGYYCILVGVITLLFIR